MMAEKASSTSLWLKFFRGAGVPSPIDTKYALLFDENRIRMDMLMDLNKEILRDMGIVAMGDIIAILKHARKVHDETKEQAVEPNKPTQSQPSSSPSKVSATSTQGRSNQAVGKTEVAESIKEGKSSVDPVGSRAKLSTATSSRSTERVVQSKVQLEVEKIREEAAPKKMIVLNKRSGSEGPLKEEVPVQKKIRVLPEQEGKYTIKMPEGTTPKTKKIIQSRLGPGPSTGTLHSQAVTDKKTVFARLGDSSVSSSTEETRAASRSSSEGSESKSLVQKPSGKQSVFDRLGGRGKQTESSSSVSSASSEPKPLLQMKVSSLEQTSSVRSRLDAKTHQEKTLKTIPSRISIPYMTNRTKVRSEISSAAASATSSTTTRIISAKPSSVPSSTILSAVLIKVEGQNDGKKGTLEISNSPANIPTPRNQIASKVLVPPQRSKKEKVKAKAEETQNCGQQLTNQDHREAIIDKCTSNFHKTETLVQERSDKDAERRLNSISAPVRITWRAKNESAYRITKTGSRPSEASISHVAERISSPQQKPMFSSNDGQHGKNQHSNGREDSSGVGISSKYKHGNSSVEDPKHSRSKTSRLESETTLETTAASRYETTNGAREIDTGRGKSQFIKPKSRREDRKKSKESSTKYRRDYSSPTYRDDEVKHSNSEKFRHVKKSCNDDRKSSANSATAMDASSQAKYKKSFWDTATTPTKKLHSDVENKPKENSIHQRSSASHKSRTNSETRKQRKNSWYDERRSGRSASVDLKLSPEKQAGSFYSEVVLFPPSLAATADSNQKDGNSITSSSPKKNNLVSSRCSSPKGSSDSCSPSNWKIYSDSDNESSISRKRKHERINPKLDPERNYVSTETCGARNAAAMKRSLTSRPAKSASKEFKINIQLNSLNKYVSIHTPKVASPYPAVESNVNPDDNEKIQNQNIYVKQQYQTPDEILLPNEDSISDLELSDESQTSDSAKIAAEHSQVEVDCLGDIPLPPDEDLPNYFTNTPPIENKYLKNTFVIHNDQWDSKLVSSPNNSFLSVHSKDNTNNQTVYANGRLNDERFRGNDLLSSSQNFTISSSAYLSNNNVNTFEYRRFTSEDILYSSVPSFAQPQNNSDDLPPVPPRFSNDLNNLPSFVPRDSCKINGPVVMRCRRQYEEAGRFNSFSNNSYEAPTAATVKIPRYSSSEMIDGRPGITNNYSKQVVFVKATNLAECNGSGEEIIRITRPPKDKDEFIPDDKSIKMMAKMGWSPGSGLGKHEQGRKAPVESGLAKLGVFGLGFGKK